MNNLYEINKQMSLYLKGIFYKLFSKNIIIDMIVVYNPMGIVFKDNGNTGGSTASMAMTYDAAKNLNANDFTKTGYRFSCRTTNADGSGSVYYNQQSVGTLPRLVCVPVVTSRAEAD